MTHTLADVLRGEIMLGAGGEAGGGDLGIADLHTEQPRIDPQLWGAIPAGGKDQHGVCGIDHQPGGEPTVRQETTNELDTERGPSDVADTDEGPPQTNWMMCSGAGTRSSARLLSRQRQSEKWPDPRLAAALL